MKLFHFILFYIMLGFPGPVSKGLASCQRWGGRERERENEYGGENWFLEAWRRLLPKPGLHPSSWYKKSMERNLLWKRKVRLG